MVDILRVLAFSVPNGQVFAGGEVEDDSVLGSRVGFHQVSGGDYSRHLVSLE